MCTGDDNLPAWLWATSRRIAFLIGRHRSFVSPSPALAVGWPLRFLAPRIVNWGSMPELPEVETIARGLAKRVTGDVIESVWLGSKPEPLKSSAAEIVATLENKRIAGVRRVGKHIVFDSRDWGRRVHLVRDGGERQKTGGLPRCTQKAQWIVHLGMTGRMLVCEADAEMAKHTHAVAKLASGRELRFVDPRRFGRLSVAQGLKPPDASRSKSSWIVSSAFSAAARRRSRALCSIRNC